MEDLQAHLKGEHLVALRDALAEHGVEIKVEIRKSKF